MGEKYTARHRVVFTQNRVASFPCPDKGRIYYYDAKTSGLCVCVTAAGSRTFYCLGKVNKRTVRVLLGKFPALSVDDARRQSLTVTADIAKGKDPQGERQARRHEHTVAGLWSYWLQVHAKPYKKEKSWKEDERQYNALLRPWAGRKLSAIKKADVQSLHARIGRQNGHYAANRVLALLRAMFNKAGDLGYRGENPIKGIKKFKEQARDRFLTEDELPAFFAALDAEPSRIYKDFFLILLLTGARRGNVQSMRWEDLDLARGLWRIPDTKAGIPIVLPLVEPALELLKTRWAETSGSPWVFSTRSKTGHLVEPKTAWKRILKRAGMEDVRMHDLRRTLGSWQALGGSSLHVIGKSLGHSQVASTQVYARLTVDSVRESLEKATKAILTAGEKSTQSGDTSKAGPVIDVETQVKDD